jgi:hypothetical protein
LVSYSDQERWSFAITASRPLIGFSDQNRLPAIQLFSILSHTKSKLTRFRRHELLSPTNIRLRQFDFLTWDSPPGSVHSAKSERQSLWRFVQAQGFPDGNRRDKEHSARPRLRKTRFSYSTKSESM